MGGSNGRNNSITEKNEICNNLVKPEINQVIKPVIKAELKPVNLQKAVESKYIIVGIFGLLNKDKKLNIITYNKKMKNILGIFLDDYKKRSVKVFVGERDGIGKEYRKDTNIIVFEGQYVNGKKNGRGKEYYENGNILIEGEYLNGKWNGNVI